MILRWHGMGMGIAGLIAYITHDPAFVDGDGNLVKPTTADRVAWTDTINSPTDDPKLTGVVMRGLVRDAPMLKALAGISARGRKLAKPYFHLTGSWEPGTQVTRDDAMDFAGQVLKKIGAEDLMAVVSFHTDHDHHHMHIAGCRVDSETGLARKFGQVPYKLGYLALEYEREHGIRVPLREKIIEARAELRNTDPDTREHEAAAARLQALQSLRQPTRGAGPTPGWRRKYFGTPEANRAAARELREEQRRAVSRSW